MYNILKVYILSPYQRLMNSEHIDAEKKKEMAEIFKQLNPFVLQKTIQKKLKRIFAMINLKPIQKCAIFKHTVQPRTAMTVRVSRGLIASPSDTARI